MPRSSPAWIPSLLVAPLALASAPARAQDAAPLPVQPVAMAAAPPPPPPVVPDREARGVANWYGWQTLVAVAPFDIAMFTGLARAGTPGATEALYTGFIGRNLAPAVVHMAHRRWSTAFGSVGLHAGMSAAGVAIGYAIGLGLQADCPPRDPCRNHFRDMPLGPGYGAIAGSMAATVLDTIFFGYRQRLSWTASAPAVPARPAWAMAPYVTSGGGGIAAAGTL